MLRRAAQHASSSARHAARSPSAATIDRARFRAVLDNIQSHLPSPVWQGDLRRRQDRISANASITNASAFIHFACLFFLRGLWNGPPMEHRGHPSPCLNGALAVASFLVAGASTWFTRSEPAVPWRSSDRGCTFSDPARSPHLRICCTGLASENSSVTDAAAVICACRLLSRPCLEVRPTRDPVLA